MRILFVLLSIFSASASFSQDLESTLRAFLEDMKAHNDLDAYITIPDSLNGESYTINFFMIDSYEVSALNSNTFIVKSDPGIGRKCVEVHFKFERDSKNQFVLSLGTVEYNPMARTYFIDPWILYSNHCRD
jgi:hypothetical protein